MTRHEGWKNFTFIYDILGQSGATRPRAKGQIKQPRLFPLLLIDVSLLLTSVRISVQS